MSVMCQHLHMCISCEIEHGGKEGGGVGRAHVCSC